MSWFGQHLANDFSRTYILPRFAPYFAAMGGPPRANVAIIWLIRIVFSTMFFCLGGGLALRTYFREQSTWTDRKSVV